MEDNTKCGDMARCCGGFCTEVYAPRATPDQHTHTHISLPPSVSVSLSLSLPLCVCVLQVAMGDG